MSFLVFLFWKQRRNILTRHFIPRSFTEADKNFYKCCKELHEEPIVLYRMLV